MSLRSSVPVIAVDNKSELLEQLKIDRDREPKPRALTLWHIVIAALLAGGVAVWLTLSLIGPAEQPVGAAQQPADTAVTGQRVNKQQDGSGVTDTAGASVSASRDDAILNSSGYITARRMATVSAEIMGLITEVSVEEGMTVTKGQVLARLDDALAKVGYDLALAQVEVLEARRNAITANLDEARRNHERIINNSFTSESERTQASSAMLSLAANLESAEADIRVARLEVTRQRERLADHTIRAPFSGVVTVKNAQPGEIVAPTSAGGGFTRTGICTIVDMQSLEIEVDVNESFIGRVYPGQPVKAHLDAYPDWTIPASVIAIIPTADRAKATVQVRIRVEQSDPRILPDMGVKVAFLK